MDKEELDYWSEQLINLKDNEKFIWNHSDESSYKKCIYREVFDKEYGSKLSVICKNNRLLIYTFLVSALKITLSKYMIKNNIVIGIPHYSSPNNRGEVYINRVIPLISCIDYENTYLEYMDSIKYKILKGYKNQTYLNSKILLQNNLPNNVMEFAPISICMRKLHEDKDINYICESSKNELSFLLDYMEDKSIEVQIIYNANKIEEVIIKSLLESYVAILKDVLNNCNKKIKDIKILSEKECNRILYEFNNTKADYPKDKTIHELFEAQVEKTPDNIAVVFEDKKLTYRELNERANSLARVLRDKGVKAESIVGIMVERSQEMIVGIMGILKSGGAYLPIDPSYPKARIEYMLKDSESKILLSKSDLAETIEFDGEVISLFDEDLFKNELENLEKVNESSNLAYVIYTSGTTGNPKGVMIEHRQVNNFIKGIVKETNLDLYKNILCITTICFDIFGLETLVPLTKGLNIVVANREEQIEGDKLSDVIKQNNIEIIQSTPSRLKVFLENKYFKESMGYLKMILIGGEEVDNSLISNLHESIDAKIFNVYGPSETTIWSTAKELKKNEKVTIGKPIINTKIYIVDNENDTLPIGVAGELCISGDGLARGYLNRPELTAEKFIENPFELGTKMYKTGDLARWLPDGNIEFLGRIDNQVKIRGFRIELSEIESRLLQLENIKEAAVLARENKENEKYICAYVVSDKKLQELDLKDNLKEILPEYMVPSYFVQVEKMPLTANGKLDRRALPEPDLGTALNEYEAPRNGIQEKLSKIWSEVLGVRKIAISHNFFDLGGHSIKAARLIQEIYKILNIKVPLRELYNNPTIKELSLYIQNADGNEKVRIQLLNEKLRIEFGERCRLIKYKTEFSEEFILYTDRFHEEMSDYIKNNAEIKIAVDYVCDYNTLVDDSEVQKISMDELDHKLKLRSIEEDEYQNILNKQELNMERLEQDILSKEQVNKYEIGCMMNENCRRANYENFRPIMEFFILFKNQNFSHNLNKILIKLINEQLVLRTSISLEGETYRFVEHNFISEVNFNIIDLSEYNYKSKIEAIKKISYLLKSSLSNESYLENVLYYFSIVKLSLNEYCFILNIDHQISDGQTSRIIKKYLEEQFEDERQSLPLNHYLQNILLADKERKFNIFNSSTVLKEYKEASEMFYEKFPYYASRKPIVFSEPFVINYWLDNDDRVSENGIILETAIYIVAKILGFEFEINDLPIAIGTNKRVWGKYNYYYTIGNFVDRLPCTFNNSYNRKSDYYNKYIEVDNQISKDNIRLRELNGDIEFTRYIYKLSPFYLNYRGDYTPLEDSVSMNSINNTKALAYLINAHSVNSSLLRINFTNGIKKESIPYIEQLMRDLGGKYEYSFQKGHSKN